MLADAWYLAAWSEELQGRPLGRRLLGRPVVLFRDRQGHALALDAVCPHRGGDLGRGRLVDGGLECPYHGWRFDDTGRCIRIPSQRPEDPIPEQARVRPYTLQEQQGLLWIWGGAAPPAGRPPWYPPLEDPKCRRIAHPAKLWPVPFPHVMDQALDNAHTRFVHGRSTRTSSALVPEVRIVIDADERGFVAENDEPPDERSGLGPREAGAWLRERLLGLPAPVGRSLRVDLGGSCLLRIDYGRSGWDALLFAAVPADERTTWVFGASARTRARHPLGEWLQRRYLDVVMAEDEESAGRIHHADYPDGFPSRISVAADRTALTFRKLRQRWDV